MKKYLTTTILTLLAALFIALPVYANDIRVTVNGEPVVFTGQTPVIVDGRTLVPVRGVFEHLGFEVDWNGEARQVTLTSDSHTVVLTIGSATFTTNNVNHTLDVPAQIIGGSAMLPIRAVLESVGYYLDWSAETQTVLISSALFTGQTSQPNQPTETLPAYITIRGEQFSTELTSLELGVPFTEHNHISDLTNEEIMPLRYMTNLTSLHISGSPISDLTPLASLTNLTQLILFSNQISDITPLAGLTNLEWLDISNNLLSDLTPLSGLTNLTRLSLISNRISDITPLAGLMNLSSILLHNNQITDWTPVEHVDDVMGRP